MLSKQNIQDSKIRNRTKTRKLELNVLAFVQEIFKTFPTTKSFVFSFIINMEQNFMQNSAVKSVLEEMVKNLVLTEPPDPTFFQPVTHMHLTCPQTVRDNGEKHAHFVNHKMVSDIIYELVNNIDLKEDNCAPLPNNIPHVQCENLTSRIPPSSPLNSSPKRNKNRRKKESKNISLSFPSTFLDHDSSPETDQPAASQPLEKSNTCKLANNMERAISPPTSPLSYSQPILPSPSLSIPIVTKLKESNPPKVSQLVSASHTQCSDIVRNVDVSAKTAVSTVSTVASTITPEKSTDLWINPDLARTHVEQILASSQDGSIVLRQSNNKIKTSFKVGTKIFHFCYSSVSSLQCDFAGMFQQLLSSKSCLAQFSQDMVGPKFTCLKISEDCVLQPINSDFLSQIINHCDDSFITPAIQFEKHKAIDLNIKVSAICDKQNEKQQRRPTSVLSPPSDTGIPGWIKASRDQWIETNRQECKKQWIEQQQRIKKERIDKHQKRQIEWNESQSINRYNRYIQRYMSQNIPRNVFPFVSVDTRDDRYKETDNTAYEDNNYDHDDQTSLESNTDTDDQYREDSLVYSQASDSNTGQYSVYSEYSDTSLPVRQYQS